MAQEQRRPYEAMSPLDIERGLRNCITELTKTEAKLRSLRDAETEADLAFRSAYRRAILSPECPKVERNGSTVAERDAWVEDHCDEQYRAHQLAKVATKSAEDHLRTWRDVTSTLQTIAAGTRAAMSLAGTLDR